MNRWSLFTMSWGFGRSNRTLNNRTLNKKIKNHVAKNSPTNFTYSWYADTKSVFIYTVEGKVSKLFNYTSIYLCYKFENNQNNFEPGFKARAQLQYISFGCIHFKYVVRFPTEDESFELLNYIHILRILE